MKRSVLKELHQPKGTQASNAVGKPKKSDHSSCDAIKQRGKS